MCQPTPACQPTAPPQPIPPTKPQVQKRKSTDPSASTTAKKSAGTSRKKAKEAPANLPYKLTDEETKIVVAADVKCQLAPVKPQPKVQIDPKTKQHFVKMLQPPLPSLPSDYDRSITKSFNERSRSSSGKKFPSSENKKTNHAPRSTWFPIMIRT